MHTYVLLRGKHCKLGKDAEVIQLNGLHFSHDTFALREPNDNTKIEKMKT